MPGEDAAIQSLPLASLAPRRKLALAVSMALLLAISPRVAEAEESPEEPLPPDEVVLRDGTMIRGQVIREEPGRFVTIETADRRRRTLAWEAIHEVNTAPADAKEAGVANLPSLAFHQRSGHRLTYELRANLVGTLSAPREYAPSGYCATGTGIADVSIYKQRARARAHGLGVGAGARGGYMYLSPPDPSSRYPLWALRAGGGVDLNYGYIHAPTGVDDIAGELCATVQKRAPSLNVDSGSMLIVQMPLQIGAHIGIGSLRDSNTWKGILVGAAWAPTLTHIEPSVGPRGTEFRWLGTELSVDFVTLEAEPREKAHPAHFRIALFIAPPARRFEPLSLTLSFGAVWY